MNRRNPAGRRLTPSENKERALFLSAFIGVHPRLNYLFQHLLA
jgi:hypothetical protein